MTPLHVGHQLHPQFQVLQQEVIETANRVGGEVCAPFELPFNGGTPPLIFPRTRYFAQKATVKPSIFFVPFSWASAWRQTQAFGELCKARNTLQTT